MSLLRKNSPAVLTMLLGVALALVVFFTLQNWQEKQVLAEFQQDARDHIHNLRNELLQGTRTLEQAKDFFEAAESNVTRKEFRAFAGPLVNYHKFIEHLGWMPLVRDFQIKDYESAARGEIPNFSFVEQDARGDAAPLAQRTEYAPVYFIEPYDKNLLGLDLLAHPAYQETIAEARGYNRTTATGRIDFVKADAKNNERSSGFALVTPVMQKSAVAGKSGQLQGYALGIFHADTLVKQAVANIVPKGINFQLLDTTDSKLIYYHPSRATKPSTLASALPDYLAAATARETFDLAGRKWTVICTASTSYQSAVATWLPWAAALMVLLLGTLVSLIEIAVASEQGAAKHLAKLLAANQRLSEEIKVRHQVEDALLDEKEYAQITLQSIGDAVITCDAEGRVTRLNPAAEKLTGVNNHQAAGQPLPAVFNISDEFSDIDSDGTLPDPAKLCLTRGETIALSNHTLLTHRDGTVFSITASVAPIRDHHQKIIGAVLVFHDVTQERSIARKLTHQATHDALTGLVNRIEFERRLERALANSREDHAQHALGYLDLDNFKPINDTCGHIAGDALLRQIGGVLQQRLRSRDTLARLGGDEFGVILERCPPDQAMRIAEELRLAISDMRFVWENKPFSVGVSIGLVMLGEHSPTAAEVVRLADAACYSAKEQGRNRVFLYPETGSVSTETAAQTDAKNQSQTRISLALRARRFRLFCQDVTPLIPLGSPVTQRLHYELKLRLIDEDDGLITPGVFMPTAERYNLTPEIDRWVVEHVVAMCKIKQQERPGDPLPMIRIILSSATVAEPGFAEFVREQLRASDFPGSLLGFELSETASLAQLTPALTLMNSLRALGCTLTINMVGGSTASFTQIKTMPVSFIKISGNLVRDIASDPVDFAIVEATHHIAHLLGMQTIATYADQPPILAKLRELGIDYVRGMKLPSPVPLCKIFDDPPA